MSSSPPAHCYHCHLPIVGAVEYTATVDNVERVMCCPGCKMVTEAIVSGGLDNYYRQRTEFGQQASSIDTQLQAELSLYDTPSQQKDFVTDTNDGCRQASLLIEGITCAACVWLLENHLGRIEGVQRMSVNLSTHECQLVWREETVPLSTLLIAIHRIGYKAHPWREGRREALLREENRTFIRRLAVSGIGTMQVMMYAIALYSGAISNDMADHFRDLFRYVSAIITTPVVLYAARPFFQASLRSLRTRQLSMDIPVSLAIGGAWLASLWATFSGGGEVYFDSVSMFTFFLLLGRYLEFRARQSTFRASWALNRQLPTSCLKEIDGEYVLTPQAELQPGDRVRVLPGAAIPADALITEGSSSLNESMLTGESLPIRRSAGESVIGGTVNIENPLDLQITQVGESMRMSAILRLQRQAQLEKPRIAQLADRAAGGFVALVLLTSVTVFGYWSLHSPSQALWITLSVLVVTCPCALSLATPTALTAATGHLHRLGFLVTRSHVLEGLKKTTHIVFDKTGTLTRGEITLLATQPVGGHHYTADDLLDIAATLESRSEHPIARAFTASGKLSAKEFVNYPGQGVEATVNNRRYRIGRANFVCQRCSVAAPDSNGSWLLLGENDTPLCWFQIGDTVRPEAARVIKKLKASGFQITLLSGDQQHIAESTAAELGIVQVAGGATPDDKLAHIKSLQQQGERVLMVGDGINDVPVLAGADVSLAMSSASDLAKTSADAILLADDLERILSAFELVQRTYSTIRQNLFWALAYNLAALPLAASALVAPWMAAIGMTTSSLVVVLNATRLARS